MELKPATTSAWIPGTLPSDLAPGPIRAILLFGPDQGGVFEFARMAARAGGDYETRAAGDVSASEVASSLSAGSLFGGAVSVRLDGASDSHAGRIEAMLDGPFADGARLIVTAGELKPGSKLRKLFGGRQDCAAVPLYPMRDRELVRFATGFCRSQGLALDGEAARSISERLSADRATAARSCEVVALHATGRGSKRVEAEDLRAILDEVDEQGLSTPLDHALAGRAAAASLACTRRLAAGESFVGLLRVFAQRCFRFREMAASGMAPREAVAKARPPVFWAERDLFVRLLAGLSPAKIDRMLAEIDATEKRIIEGAIPAEAAMPALMWSIGHHRNWKE